MCVYEDVVGKDMGVDGVDGLCFFVFFFLFYRGELWSFRINMALCGAVF